MKLIAAFLTAFLLTPAAAMEPSKIMELVAKPHDEQRITPQLRVVWAGREMEVVARSGKPGAPLTQHKPVIVKDKVVEGKYVISEFQPENTPSPICNVVTYDEAATAYRQWTLFPGGKVVEAIGVVLRESRAVTWTYFETPYGENTQSVSVAVLTETGGAWREIVRDGRNVVFITEGTIRVIR